MHPPSMSLASISARLIRSWPQIDAEGRPTIVANAEGEITTPSVVFLDPAGAIVGREAMKAAEFEPDKVARHPKRSMGLKHFPTQVRGEQWPPEVLQAAILRRLKLDAERMLGPLTQRRHHSTGLFQRTSPQSDPRRRPHGRLGCARHP